MKGTGKYILVGHTPVFEPDPLKWAAWFETHDRDCVVARTQVGDVLVSTIFLGLDHNFFFSGPPILFETMIFIDGEPGFQERCSTWEEAERQHAQALETVRPAGAEWERFMAALHNDQNEET